MGGLFSSKSAFKGRLFESGFDKRKRQEMEVKFTMALESRQLEVRRAMPKLTWNQKKKTEYIYEVVKTPWRQYEPHNKDLEWEREMEVSECLKSIGSEVNMMNRRVHPEARRDYRNFHRKEVCCILEGQKIKYKNFHMYNGDANSMDKTKRFVDYDYTDNSFVVCLRHRESERCVVAAVVVEKLITAKTDLEQDMLIWEVPFFTREAQRKRWSVFDVNAGMGSPSSSKISPTVEKKGKKGKKQAKEHPATTLFKLLQKHAKFKNVHAINFTAAPVSSASWYTCQFLEKGCRFVPQIIYSGDEREIYGGAVTEEQRECLQFYFTIHKKPINGDVAAFYRSLQWRIKLNVGVHIWLFVNGKLSGGGISNAKLHPKNRAKQQRQLKEQRGSGERLSRDGGYGEVNTRYRDTVVAQGNRTRGSQIKRARAEQARNGTKIEVF
eukprot:g5200.t1